MKRIFFRNQGLSVQSLISAWLNGNRIQFNWPGFEQKHITYTHLGRIGIVLACRLWNISKEDEVLIPSYNCGSEVDPFIWAGLKPVLYRIDQNAKIDFNDLKSRITNKTRILYVTHYFGWPQELNEIIVWCRERKIYLMEDCALSLFSNGPDGPIGQIGDAAIFSFRKTLPVPDGAALILSDKKWKIEETFRQPDYYPIVKETIPFIIRWLIKSISNFLGLRYVSYSNLKRPLHLNSKNIKTWHQDIQADYYFDGKIENWSISRLSKGILNNIDPVKVVQQRRNNYTQLAESIKDLQGIRLLFNNLPKGVCPLLLPILVSNPVTWQNALNKKRIAANRWWVGYHRSLNWDEFPEASKLKENLLVLPVNQDLRKDDMDYISDSMWEIAGSFA